jgi:hypothetical protein
MNITEYLQYEFCTTTESMLSDRIRLAEALEKYQNGNFDVEQKVLFEDCVQKTISGEYDRYIFNNEMGKKLFRFTSQSKIELYKHLIFFESGKRLSVSTDNLKFKQLDEYGDKMDYGFYLSYTINEVKLNKLISSISPTSILKETRSFVGHRNDVYDFCEKEIKAGISEEEIISLISPYNDGSYVELPEYISFLSYLLLRDRRYNLWVTMLTKAKYFPLQGALLYHIHTLQEYMSILQELKRPNIIHRNVILYLLRDRYFQIISKQPKTLQRGFEYLTKKRNGSYGIMYKQLIDEWNNDIEPNTTTVFEYLSAQLGLSNCSKWYSKISNQYVNGDKRFVEYEQKAVDVIGKTISKLSNPVKWNVSTADINTLLYYISQTDTKQITQYRSKLLVQSLFNRLYNNSTYYQIKFNEESFNILSLTYKCLIQSKLDPLQMLQSVSYANEGYKPDYKQATMKTRGDAFWFSMLLLGAGEQEDECLFNTYVGFLLQRVLAQAGEAKEYTFPLYISELVVNQALTKSKDGFEIYIINNIPNLSLVLTTLSANQGNLSPHVKEILLERISEEWNIEKTLMIQQKDSNLKVLSDYIQKIKL